VIQALNGTLMLGSQAEIKALHSQLNVLEKENQTLNKQVEEMQATLNLYADLSADMQDNRAEILLLKQARDKLEGQTETLSQRADTLDASVISLAEEAVKMEKSITQLENDAGRFNTFLTGLRTLMISVVDETDAEMTPAVPEKDATATPTTTPQK
jgi:chromosome segregation ATPase